MTSARSSIQRVFTPTERTPMPAGQEEALAVLASEVRVLVEAVIHSDLPPEELAEITRELAVLNARLNSARRESPPVADLMGNGMVRQLASPVTGRINPLAPPVQIVLQPDGTARTEFTLSNVYEGPPGFVHGGVSALILDQLLGYAAAANGTPGMTATLDMKYRRPTPLHVPLVAEARTDRVDGRKTFVKATITNPEGQVTIEAVAMFVYPRR